MEVIGGIKGGITRNHVANPTFLRKHVFRNERGVEVVPTVQCMNHVTSKKRFVFGFFIKYDLSV